MKSRKPLRAITLKVLLGTVIILLTQCDLFHPEKTLKTIITDSDQTIYEVIYTGGNATTNSSIQIKRLLEGDRYKTIAVLEGYTDFVMFEKTAQDSVSFGVWLDVGDFPRSIKTQIDTFKIYLPAEEVLMVRR